MRCWAGCASVALALAGCGEPVRPPVPPVALVLTASDTIRAAGGTLTFTAVATDSAGRPVRGYAVVWSVSDEARGAITGAGVFTAGPDSGRVYVRATVLSAPPLRDSLAVRVVAPGTLKWRWAAAEVGGYMPPHGGPALALDGTVYVLVGNAGWPDFPGTLVALNPDGTLRWGLPLQQVEGATGPVVTPGSERVWMVGRAAYLVAPTGQVLWDSLADADVSPLFLGGAASLDRLVAAWGKHVVGYRAADQVRLWTSPQHPLIGWLVPATITADGQVLAKVTDDSLFVFHGTTGQILRTFADPDTGVNKRVFGVGTLPVGGRLYLPTFGRLAAFDTAGPLLWLTGPRALGIPEPAVGPEGTLYIQNRTFGLEAISPDGSTQWYRRTPLGNTGWVEQPRWPWYGGLALAAGGILYAAAQASFLAHDVSGAPLWQYVADSAGVGQAFVGAPAIAPDGTVYTFTSTHVYAFWGPAPPEPNSPWPMWRHDAQRTGWAR